MRGRISIDVQRCKGCKYCILACPKKLLEQERTFNTSGYFTAKVVSMEECTGCALCAEVCPEIAIEVWRENGNKDG